MELQGQISIFDVQAYETKDNKFQRVERHIEVKELQMRVICECLNIARETLVNSKPANTSSQKVIGRKLNEIEEVMALIEIVAGYKFSKQLEKCKKKNGDDVAEDAMVLSASKKSNS